MRRLLQPLLILILAVATSAQTSPVETSAQLASPRLLTEELDSKLMGRKIPYRVVLPDRYQEKTESGRRYPVIFLLHGLTGHFDNWTTRTQLVAYSAKHATIIVTPEGENGWYTDNVAKESDKYESYIIKELIPEIDKKYRTMDRREHRGIAGLSMGGFGAIKFGLKYPDMFALAASFSGALSAARITEKEVPGAIGKTIDAIFGPAGGEIRKSNDPFDMIQRATPDTIKKYPFLYIDCGTEDFLFQSNRDFVSLLLEKRVPHEFRQLPGAHNWEYWNKQVKELLEVADGVIGAR